jgi:multiple sugar transport system substrate-binding protein/sn-glycerol 3-phosphate transport system substrate-binding protein
MKKFSLFAILALMLFSLVPVFGQETVPYDDVDPTGATVVFWHQHTGARADELGKIVDEFNTTNEWKIIVEASNQGGYDDIFQKMTLGLAGGGEDLPNLVVAYQNQAATYQLVDGLVDLNALVDSEKWGLTKEEQADFFPAFWNSDVFPTFDNQRLGIAPNRSMEVMYYNSDWLAELKSAGAISFDGAPTTPDQFKEAACAAAKNPFSKATGDKANSIGYELSVDASRFASWTFGQGGDIFDYENGVYTLNSDAAKAAMAFLQDLYASGCARTVTESFGDQTNFGAGTTLFTVGSSSGLPFYKSAVEDGANFAWSLDAVPHTSEDPRQNIYGASVSIPKTTPEQELAAWLFVKYYTSPSIQVRWGIVSNYFPVRASAVNDAAIQDIFSTNAAYKTAFDLLQFGVAEPPVPGYDPVRKEMANAMVAIADGADVATTLDALNETANGILESQ